jgi:hypothetical protein
MLFNLDLQIHVFFGAIAGYNEWLNSTAWIIQLSNDQLPLKMYGLRKSEFFDDPYNSFSQLGKLSPPFGLHKRLDADPNL